MEKLIILVQKAALQKMHPAHVINLLLIFICLSCSSLKLKNTKDTKLVIEKELIRNSQLNNGEEIYFDFNLNNQLKKFLNKNLKSNNLHPSIITKFLSSNEIQILFNNDQIRHFIEQLKNNQINISALNLPSNINKSNIITEREKIGDQGLKMANYMTRNRLFLSIPVFSKNGDYSLVAQASGILNAMQGNIVIYKKEGGNWKFYKNIVLWIE